MSAERAPRSSAGSVALVRRRSSTWRHCESMPPPRTVQVTSLRLRPAGTPRIRSSSRRHLRKRCRECARCCNCSGCACASVRIHRRAGPRGRPEPHTQDAGVRRLLRVQPPSGRQRIALFRVSSGPSRRGTSNLQRRSPCSPTPGATACIWCSSRPTTAPRSPRGFRRTCAPSTGLRSRLPDTSQIRSACTPARYSAPSIRSSSATIISVRA